MYDGSLAGIIDRFSGHKVITLQFADDNMAGDWRRYGEVLEQQAPKVQLRVDRDVRARSAGRDPGRAHGRRRQRRRSAAGEVIAEMFSQAGQAVERS